MPLPVGPQTRIKPCGMENIRLYRSKSRVVNPRASTSWNRISGSMIRMTTFSPNATGTVEIRISTSTLPLSVLIRPSWGRRFSAMSRRERLLIRLTMAECTFLGSLYTVCRTPSMRMRIKTVSRLGSM